MFRKLKFRKSASRTGCKANPRDFISTGDIPLGCRELTDEEAFKVNGGSKEETGEKKDSTKSTVTVNKNDTLGQLVSDYNNEHGTNFTVGQIAELNGISNPDVIHPGQEISFSFNTPQSAPSASPTSTPTPSISMTQESPASGVTPSKPVAATASPSTGSVNENPGTTVAKRTSVSGAGNSSEKSLISLQQESTLGSDSVNATVSSQTDYGTEWFSNAYNAHVEDYKRAAIKSGIQGRNTEGKKVEGKTNEGYNAAEEKKDISAISVLNPVSPDNLVTNNQKKAEKGNMVGITEVIKNYNEKNNTNYPLSVESYNYFREKGETFGYQDNAGWTKLNDQSNAYRTMQEGKGKLMLDGTALEKQGCKVMTATKIASEITGEKVEMDFFNEKATNGLLSMQTVADGVNELLIKNGDERRVEGKRYEGDDVNRALLDSIASSTDTTYVYGMANNVAGGTHWFELDGYSMNSFGETQFRYYPSSNNDINKDRTYILGSLQTQRPETYSVSVIETLSIK